MKIPPRTTVRLPWRKPFFLLVFILQLVACSLWGQVMQKKTLTVADYPKWGRLNIDKMSPNGEWISYTMSYHSGLDTLFIKNTKSLKTHFFALGNRSSFITSDWFTCQTTEGLQLMNLKTGKKETVFDAVKYVYTPIAKKLLILIKEKKKLNTLLIRELDGVAQDLIMGVNEFTIDPTNQKVLYTTTMGKEHTVGLLELSKKNQKTILLSSTSSFSNLVWHIKGKALAFMQKSIDASSPSNTIFYYNLSSKKLYKPNPEIEQTFLSDSLFIPTVSYKLKISDDMQSVFFAVVQRAKAKDSTTDSDVQLWNGNAKLIYPMQEKLKQNQTIYLALWHPLTDRYRLISNDSLSEFMLSGDQNYAILSDPQQYEPQYAYNGPRDFYLVDLSTGKSELLLKKHSGHSQYTIASPTGKYISYFQQGNWWVYTIAKKTHANITENIGQSFSNNENEYPQKASPYSSLGWTQQDKEILLYNAYDIWAISPDGVSVRRLTQGREIQTCFRLAGFSNKFVSKENYNGRIHETIDLNQGLLLAARNEQEYSGYYKWSPRSNEKMVFSDNMRLDELIQSASGDTFAYKEERYDLSPRLMLQTPTDKVPKILFQSNPQQQDFYWGKAELIHYKNAKGKSLQGILYYPAGYDNQKKYPMIVYIYEKLSQGLHNKYINPSEFTGDGMFNISTFTTQGYFVLAPDISYEIGNPGVSATDCVVSATNEVIARGLILPDKIGLIGHSFGGYETDFIITQTNLFAAAVAGAAATDLTSWYLTVGASGRPDMWRFENDQHRMGKSLFEDKEGYDRNSPIVHVKNITTPLLSWSGAEDKQVNWNQSIELYLALRRLEKKHIMLLYPKEQHILTNSGNQKDLSIRLHQWFDYHLKNVPPATWIKTGLK
ncbi:prolyl oligopeptidase family serine peptidase [Flavobacterium sp. LS1R49]|uniref:Prolyl oligopeptidase family serine peptidase n=1 Tax=Flavobacterium shii TaxID=2987687 RepID=A0A9X3C429_9FLAO|nr:prolyl oligopeptidase family serine peptidase [Flavobacterium shii]MCV9926609.1 prolyl oligopeptidase family serine peptidase [Flavobacterium shii]